MDMSDRKSTKGTSTMDVLRCKDAALYFPVNQKVKAGDGIFISTHSVNRDPKVFVNPNQYLLTRKHTMHLSYGFAATI